MGEAFCFKGHTTEEHLGPGSYNTPGSIANEKGVKKSHNYLIKKSEQIARYRNHMWLARKLKQSQANRWGLNEKLSNNKWALTRETNDTNNK